ncbi:MAG: hypothetical protein WCJ93_11470 [Methanomicrobiales archaeon]
MKRKILVAQEATGLCEPTKRFVWIGRSFEEIAIRNIIKQGAVCPAQK